MRVNLVNENMLLEVDCWVVVVVVVGVSEVVECDETSSMIFEREREHLLYE